MCRLRVIWTYWFFLVLLLFLGFRHVCPSFGVVCGFVGSLGRCIFRISCSGGSRCPGGPGRPKVLCQLVFLLPRGQRLFLVLCILGLPHVRPGGVSDTLLVSLVCVLFVAG